MYNRIMGNPNITDYLATLSKILKQKQGSEETIVALKPNLNDANTVLPAYFEIAKLYGRRLKITTFSEDYKEVPQHETYFLRRQPDAANMEHIVVYLSEEYKEKVTLLPDKVLVLMTDLNHYHFSDGITITRNMRGDTKEFLLRKHPEVLNSPIYLEEYDYCLDLPAEYTMVKKLGRPLNFYAGYKTVWKTKSHVPDKISADLYNDTDMVIELIPEQWGPKEILENRSQLFPKSNLFFVWSATQPGFLEWDYN